MKLRAKTLLIVTIVVCVMFIFMYGASQIVLMDSFDRLDEKYSIETVKIVENALNDSINTIDRTTGDWAVWEDSYFFIKNKNENFSIGYLNADTNTNLKINLMAYLDLSGKIVGSFASDIDDLTERPVPDYFKGLSDNDVLLHHQGVIGTNKGIILLPEGPMLLASWPVTNKGKLPVGGTIILGRYLDESEIGRLSGITHLPITIRRFNDTNMSQDFHVALSFLSKDNPVFIQKLSDTSIAGYTILNDIFGNPALILKVETSRLVHERGKETVDYFILFLVIIGVIFVVVFLFLIKYFVLKSIKNLDGQVQDISRSGDVSSRVSIRGDGTYPAYHRTLNKMMDSLTLRNKTLTIMGVIFLILIILLFTASQMIVMDQFNRLEEEYTHQKAQFSVDTLNDDVNKLSITEVDWASWDDTYIFINDSNENYLRSNIRLEIFTNLRLNLMLFINSSGNIVYGKAYDLENHTEVPVPGYFKEELSLDNYLLQHFDNKSSKTGILIISGGPMLVASQPILQNGGIGPIRGTMIMGRSLNYGETKHLSELIRLPISVYLFDDQQKPFDLQAVLPFVSKDEPIYIRPVSEESIAGYALIYDIYGKPGVILKVELPREIYEQGKETLRFLLISMLIICTVFSILIVVLLEIFVLRRIDNFDSQVGNIGQNGTTSSRVVVGGKDELSNLAGSLNNMLDALERSQERVKENEAKNRAILEAIPDLILQIRKNGVISNYKGSTDKHQMGLSRECIGRDIHDVIPWDIAQQIMDNVQKTLLTKEKQIFQYQLAEEGNTCYYEARTVVFTQEDVLAIITDITDRIQADEARQVSERKYLTLVEKGNDGIIIIKDGLLEFTNSKMADIGGYKPEEVIGKPFFNFVSAENTELVINNYKKRLSGDITPNNYEIEIISKDGRKIPVEINASVIDYEGKKVEMAIVRDITERRHSQENIRRSLEEKEMLLREIHHRVKNNMQIISSLLGLQAQNIEDEKYKEIFIQSQTRIDSMALIHQKLYQSESIAQINFKDYIDGIVTNIFESYCTKSNIKFDLDVENIPLKIDYAVPCGLIINELVTNCLKYAFPDERQGNIQISVRSKENNMIQLSIRDDGIGIPEDLDIRNTESLGLRLVSSLVESQLEGEIMINRDGGTEFLINFRQEKR
ncbi:MAG: PAS domain S-box protein [Candidatus Methanoperedens sp.]|nr:PAS domain S-box protein [Candidatus Methanoperedens sp.]